MDGIIATADALVYKGVVDCSTNPNYPAADKGHVYKVSVAGKIGGASGTTVEAGDMLICNTDSTASGTQATVGSKWDIIQNNIDLSTLQPKDADLTAIAGLTGTGFAVRTASDTWANRTITAGTGISITNGDGISGNVTVAHTDTSTQATVTNTGRTYIQSITLDGMGHVTGLASATETVTDTNYYPTTYAWSNGTTAGPTGSLTGTGMSAVSFGAIPSASGTVSGIVTTGDQTFAGTKTFTSNIVGNVTGNVSGSSGSCTGNAATATTASSCTGNAATATKAYTTANTTDTLYLIGVTSASSGNQSLQLDASTYVTSDGYLYATRVYNAVYNDYAECFDNKELTYTEAKNKIVELDENNNTVLAKENSNMIIGVVSDSFGHMLGGTEEEIQEGSKMPIGLAGVLYVDSLDRVDIKNRGKFITSGGNGLAKVLDTPISGSTVGKIIDIDEVNNRYKVIITLM
jgi:hypothetical protein